MRRDEGRVLDPVLVFKMDFLGDGRRALDGENLTRALKNGGPRSEWKGRKGDERRWRWRIGKIDEINKFTNESTWKRELLNSRMQECRKRKRSTPEQLDSLAQNKSEVFTSILGS
ncbi:hypothetical protein TNCV_1826231 [Trichonephila clavipes]|nr:hypothetical protein TNCV_1826231 [Trichonephila clavipes]